MSKFFEEPDFKISSISGGNIIKTARELRQYSRPELCHSLGFSLTTLKNWENRVNEPPYPAVTMILDFTGLRFEDVWEYAV